ncbi:MAG: RDD family protein [Pseudomonadota bacterium]|nr:MAG: RDD family protein [Pseudomonadota bacterium]
MHTPQPKPTQESAAIWRRLAAIVYDSLVLIAVILLATALASPFINEDTTTSVNPLLSIYLCCVAFGFFGWFWTHGGQTLGMRAWRLRLVSANSENVGWRQSLVRFVSGVPAWALLSIGVISWATPVRPAADATVVWLFDLPPGWLTLGATLWVIWDNSRYSWRERASATRVILLPKR